MEDGMPELTPTLDILRRLAVGADEQAWRDFLNLHANMLLRVANSRCQDAHLADDGVQEALLYIREHAQECRATTEAQALAWVSRVVATSTTQVIRQQTARVQRDRRHGKRLLPGAEASAADKLASAEVHQAVHKAVIDLPERHRLPLELHYFAGLDHQAMADAMRCSPGTARVRVHRALKRLQTCLKRMGVTASTAAIATSLSATEAPAFSSDILTHWESVLHAPTATAGAQIPVAAHTGGQLMFGLKIALAAAVVGGVTVSQLDLNAPDAMPVGENPIVEVTPPQNPPEDEGTVNEDVLDRQVSFEFKEATLEEAMVFITQSTGIEVVWDPLFKEQILSASPPFTLQGKMKLRTMLAWIEKLISVRIVPKGQQLHVGPTLDQRLEVKMSVDLQELEASEAADVIQSQPGAPRIDVLVSDANLPPISMRLDKRQRLDKKTRTNLSVPAN